MTALESALGIVEAVLADHPDLPTRRLDARHWKLVLQGEVRFAIPVGIEVGPTTTTLSSFFLRGSRTPAALHRLLLRKNASTRRVLFALDFDDDVVLVARLATASLTGDELEQTLAEILTVGESAFESLVHLAYPGVFPQLPRSRRTGEVAAAGLPQAGLSPGRGRAANGR